MILRRHVVEKYKIILDMNKGQNKTNHIEKMEKEMLPTAYIMSRTSPVSRMERYKKITRFLRRPFLKQDPPEHE